MGKGGFFWLAFFGSVRGILQPVQPLNWGINQTPPSPTLAGRWGGEVEAGASLSPEHPQALAPVKGHDGLQTPASLEQKGEERQQIPAPLPQTSR